MSRKHRTARETTCRPARRWRGTAAIAAFLVTVAACGSDGTADDTAEDASVTEQQSAAETTTTTEAAMDDQPDATSEADGDANTAQDQEEAAEEQEPRFELVGELDLTTAEINAMIEFVEASAGREFVRPPKIEIQSIADFEAGLAPSAEMQAAMDENVAATARFYQALGYTTEGVEEVATSMAELGQSTDFISGRYDPTDDVVYIPDGALTGDAFNAILVHELLHALDGQYADLAGLIERAQELAFANPTTDEAFGIAAVVEGRATAVQFEWMMENIVAPIQTEIPDSFDTVPAAAINAALLPYQLGAQSITELGGASETWYLYDNLPETSEQMVFPTRIDSDTALEVAAPQVDGEIFTEGVNGAVGILVLGIGETYQPAPSLIIEALGAAEGWGGDYFILHGSDTESCLTGAIVADTPEDLAELEALFTEWSERETTHPAIRSATVADGTLTITSCAPFNA